MCGITGIIYHDKSRPIDPAVLKQMADAIAHRGPDDEGFYMDNNVGLGFRRLSIIDLVTGHQPMSNRADTVTIVFNGEIYNYREQRELLIKKGYQFETATDTEVILHLYEEYGVDCLQHLRGMFGFAIWDKKKQQLFCARDRFGIKPFYYYQDDQKFVFGSEIKAILKAGAIDKTISHTALDSYFAYGYITSDLSIYQRIKKLQPGHFLLWSCAQKPDIQIGKYWEVRLEPDYSRSIDQWKEELESCLAETARLHMISDVPLGAFLSGGIDSSSVVAMMAKNSTVPIKTFSIGFKEQEFNELQYAREVVKKYGCEHRELIVEPESISLLPKLVHAYDEPFADASAIPTYYVTKMAREHVTVALSGDGGDELFAGYDIYYSLNKIHSYPFSFNSPNLNRMIWGSLHNLMPYGVKGKFTAYYLGKDKQYLGAYMNYWPEPERKKLLLNSRDGLETNSASEAFKKSIIRRNTSGGFVANLQYLDMHTYMVDDILTKVDRASMLNSLEVRVPLLDHKFAELSFKIPWQLKLRGKELKYIFKQSMASNLPENVLKHPKQGFGVPLSVWFKNDLRSYIQDTLLSENPRIAEYLHMKSVRNVITNHNARERDFGSKIWSLVIFEEWLRQNNG